MSLCVPAIPKDFESGCLLGLVRDVQQQTVKPVEVVVVLSNASREIAGHAKQVLQAAAKPIPITLVRIPELQLQGTSRNVASLLARGTLVSFIDADDGMHRQRIEMLVSAFQEQPKLMLALHAFTDDLITARNNTILRFGEVEKMRKQDLCAEETATRNQPHLNIPTQHAHVTVRSTVFNSHWYEEDKIFHRSEDSLFIRHVIQSSCMNDDEDILFLRAPLSRYQPSEKRERCR